MHDCILKNIQINSQPYGYYASIPILSFTSYPLKIWKKFYTWIVKRHLEQNKIFFYIFSIYSSQFGTKKNWKNLFMHVHFIIACFFIHFYLFSIFCISLLSYKVRYKYDKQNYVTVQICMCVCTHVVRDSERKKKFMQT